MKTKVVFLDRDGCINEIRHDESGGLLNYVNSWRDFVWLPGSKEAIVKLLEEDYFVCVVSNQAGVGKGFMSRNDSDNIMGNMELQINSKMLKPEGKYLVSELRGENPFQWYYCPHTPEDNCSCRKPQPGMIYAAAYEHDLSLKDAWMVGDQLSDLKAGWAAGIRKLIMIGEEGTDKEWRRNRLEGKPFPNLASAVEFIIEYDKENM